MNEEIELITDETRDRMEKALEHLEHELARLRAGRSNPALLDGITVDYYGVNSPLTAVSNINTPDPKTIMIQPWEKNMLGVIEKAIMAANIGLTPVNNGEVIRINIPPLTEERRHQLVKQVRNEGETAKISIRNARKWANDELKQLLKDGLPEDLEKDAVEIVQEMTHTFNTKVDKVMALKETFSENPVFWPIPDIPEGILFQVTQNILCIFIKTTGNDFTIPGYYRVEPESGTPVR
jgi:ribosome recycling factor